MTVAVAVWTDAGGEEWVIKRHGDQTAEVWYRPEPGAVESLLMARSDLYRILAFLDDLGIGRIGWVPG